MATARKRVPQRQKIEAVRRSRLGSKFFAFFRLVRFEHALMFSLSVLIAEIIAFRGIPGLSIPLAISLLVPIFSEMGAFAMNDLLDIESDRLNRKHDRPLVSGALSPKFAGQLTVFSFLLALVLAYAVNFPVFLITLAVIILAALYNLVLKDLPLLGNTYIAFTMAIPFIFGNYAVSGALEPANAFVAALGFLAGFAREIGKTAEDVKGDQQARKSRTLPTFIGVERSLSLAGMIYALFVLVSLVPYYLYFQPGPGLAVVLAADLLFVYISLMLVFSHTKTSFAKAARKLSLLALFLGLVGILASALGY